MRHADLRDELFPLRSRLVVLRARLFPVVAEDDVLRLLATPLFLADAVVAFRRQLVPLALDRGVVIMSLRVH